MKLASQKPTCDRSSQYNSNFYESERQVGRSKYKKKKKQKMSCFDQKRHIKGRKHVAPMNLAEYLNKLDLSENSKVYYERFLRNRLYERHCYISKSRLE